MTSACLMVQLILILGCIRVSTREFSLSIFALFLEMRPIQLPCASTGLPMTMWSFCPLSMVKF